MEDVGGCLLIAKETGNLLKNLEIGLRIIVSIERPMWISVESQSKKCNAPKAQSNKLL